MESKRKVLFLCTGNSCRSQMAEAIVNTQLGDEWSAFSAGTEPAGYVHPMALEALREIGIAHAGQSKSVQQFVGQPFDLVMTVCDSAAENCPVWFGQGQRAHISFRDPAKFSGTPAETRDEFRAVRDEIAKKVTDSLKSFRIAE
jgi:arsenate reductase (thioredoxin)